MLNINLHQVVPRAASVGMNKRILTEPFYYEYIYYNVVTPLGHYSSLARGGKSTPSCLEPKVTIGVP